MSDRHGADRSGPGVCEGEAHGTFTAAELADLETLREDVLQRLRATADTAADEAESLAELPASRRASGANLLHYLALRRVDQRGLQQRLAEFGLSSLGRSEAHVRSTLKAVLKWLHLGTNVPLPPEVSEPTEVDLEAGRRLLANHADTLLGPVPKGRMTRVMVTLPGEAAYKPELIRKLVEAGLDLARINCAHDGPAEWERMIGHLAAAGAAAGRKIPVMMDLAGPKLRTGPLVPGPEVLKIRPRRDATGRVTAPAHVLLAAEGAAVSANLGVEAILPVASGEIRGIFAGDRLRFLDARGAAREWVVVEVGTHDVRCRARQTCYVESGLVLQRRRRGERGTLGRLVLGSVPAREQPLSLNEGDVLEVTRSLEPGEPARLDAAGQVVRPARIGCTAPQIFSDVKAGEAISFDDGKIHGRIEQVDADRLRVRLERLPVGGAKLRSDKGINLPDSTLRLEAMTPKDRADLAFVAAHADLVALSFVNVVEDIRRLRAELDRLGRRPGVILKIETQRGFRNLPGLLLEAMKAEHVGVMIARGDLAVECGFERMAELQEEILWLCEAAHVPVIWATQVLESLAKGGLPSRAEISDAALANRAECVMLNKGPHIVRAVRVLVDVLVRMQSHQTKKQTLLRELKLATEFLDGTAPA